MFWGTVVGGRYRLARGTTVGINFQVRFSLLATSRRQLPAATLRRDLTQMVGPVPISGHTDGPYPRNLDTGCDYAAVGSVAARRAS